MFSPQLVFDTRYATNKSFVTLTTTFTPRKPIKSNGYCSLTLDVNGIGKRKRINLGIDVDPKLWNKQKQKLNGSSDEVVNTNLMIDNIKSKITTIRTFFMFSNKLLTTETFEDEFVNELPRADFVNFFYRCLEERKHTISNSTYLKETSVYRKLKQYKESIYFNNIDVTFFDSFRNYLAKTHNNNKQTRNGNIKIIKKYLNFAVKSGVKLSFDLRDVKAGPTKGQKEYLFPHEVKNLYKYYTSEFIPGPTKIKLGYFLFSCFTGLRFGDTLKLKRKVVLEKSFKIINQKTGKQQYINLNSKAIEIAKHCDALFVTKYSNQKINNALKTIASSVGITKNVHYHMSRYTFATSYIRLGGDIYDLQQLMNHSSVEETKEYVRLVENEKNRNADLLDNLF